MGSKSFSGYFCFFLVIWCLSETPFSTLLDGQALIHFMILRTWHVKLAKVSLKITIINACFYFSTLNVHKCGGRNWKISIITEAKHCRLTKYTGSLNKTTYCGTFSFQIFHQINQVSNGANIFVVSRLKNGILSKRGLNIVFTISLIDVLSLIIFPLK